VRQTENQTSNSAIETGLPQRMQPQTLLLNVIIRFRFCNRCLQNGLFYDKNRERLVQWMKKMTLFYRTTE
jgi:hypothetical protein